MKPVSHKLREFAEVLRKHSAEQVSPKPTPNPTASLAQNDLGSMSADTKTPGAPNLAPKLPKVGV